MLFLGFVLEGGLYMKLTLKLMPLLNASECTIWCPISAALSFWPEIDLSKGELMFVCHFWRSSHAVVKLLYIYSP